MLIEQERLLLNAYYAFAAQESSKSLTKYLDHVLINSLPEPTHFSLAAYPFQRDRMRRICPAIEAVCGLRPDYTGPRGFFEVARRGMDKTTGLARILNWVLAFSPRPVKVVAAASDKDQASLLVTAMKDEAKLNPWLSERINFTVRQITGPGGELRVQSADAGSAYGLLPDIMVLDEIVWWPKRDLFDALMSGRQKRPGAVTLIITNAGILPSWQADVHEQLGTMDDWQVFSYPTKIKTWMNQHLIDSERKLLPDGLARRVFDNIWIDAAEDSGFLTSSMVTDAVELGKRMRLAPTAFGQAKFKYFVGVDYGSRKDRTAITVCHMDGNILGIDQMNVFCGTPAKPVSLDRVEATLREINLSYNRPIFVIDPWQMENVIQHISTIMKIVRFDVRGGQRNYAMAELLRSLFSSNRISFWEGCGKINSGEDFAMELKSLIVKPTGSSYRFDHTKNKHDDRTVSLGMAALEMFSKPVHGVTAVPKRMKTTAIPGTEVKELGINMLARKDSGRLGIFGV